MTQHVRLETIDGVTVATWTDSKITHEARDALYDLSGNAKLLLDLGNVRFLSSNALAILVSLRKKVEAAGGRLRLCGLDPDLVDLFRITNLDRLFEVFGSRQEALQGF
jgi:anti-sigma B factor antagonist